MRHMTEGAATTERESNLTLHTQSNSHLSSAPVTGHLISIGIFLKL